MKKLVAIFFLSIYSLATVGATINAHYCMGEFVGSSLFHQHNDECPKCGMTTAKSKGCCEDKQTFIKVKNDHSQIKTVAEVPVFFAETLLPFYISYNVVSVSYSIETKKPILHLPPLINTQRLHLLHCVFLI